MFQRFRDRGEQQDQNTAVGLPLRPAKNARPEGSEKVKHYISLKVRLHQKLLDLINLSAIDRLTREELMRQISPIVTDLLQSDGVALNANEYVRLLDELLDEVLGLGPIEPLLKDPTVSDILINTYKRVYVERFGQLEETPIRFKDDKHLMRVVQKIVSAVGRRVDESQPWVDARLPDGSRVNAMVPPCAVDGPLVSIRKFSKTPLTIETLIETGSLSRQMAEVLEAVVRSRLNVLISGGTGSGKTTLLNALSSLISNRERIITIEDTAELQLQQEHVGRMETRPKNIEGTGEISQTDLVRNALRMRPDRIIVGEVRGAEVLDMLQAMNTGHEGSMTTIHANSSRDALTRLEHMTAMTGLEIPLRSLRSQMASAIHVIVQVQRQSDGKRRIVSIQEIVGMEGDIVSMQEIFRYERMGVDKEGHLIGQHRPLGIRPKFARIAEEHGISLSSDLFTPENGRSAAE